MQDKMQVPDGWQVVRLGDILVLTLNLVLGGI